MQIRNSLRDTRYPAVLEIHGAAICEEAVFLVDDILHLTGESLVHHIDRSDMLQYGPCHALALSLHAVQGQYRMLHVHQLSILLCGDYI